MAIAAAAVHMPRGNMTTTAATTTTVCVSLSLATMLLGAADSNNDSEELNTANTAGIAAATAATAATAVVVNKRKKVNDAGLSPRAAVSKKSRTSKEGKKDPLSTSSNYCHML